MRKLVLILALMGLCSCQVLKRGGEALCDAQEEAAEVISRAGEWVGLAGTGTMFSDTVNLGLEFFCKVFYAGLAAPAAVGDLVGVPSEEEGALARPVTDPGVEGDDGSYQD